MKPCPPIMPLVPPLPEARDPEDRVVPPAPEFIRDKMLDKTLADSFPSSDPPSSIPDPSADDSFATEEEKRLEQELCADVALRERKTA